MTFLLSFKPGVTIKEDGADRVLSDDPLATGLRVKNPSPGITELLYLLGKSRGTEDALCDAITDIDGVRSVAKCLYYIRQFHKKSFLSRQIRLDNAPLACLIPVSRDFRFNRDSVEPNLEFVLSRFAFCRCHDGHMLLESPLGHGKVEMSPPAMQILGELSVPVSVSGICQKLGIEDHGAVRDFFTLLLNARAIETPMSNCPRTAREIALAHWEFHDLLFHTRSRQGRHDNPSGGYYPFKDKIPPLPAVKPAMADRHIPLYRPDLNDSENMGDSFFKVLEERKSVRDYSLTPLTAKQLGEFLFRACRVKTLIEADPDRGAMYPVSHRPSPSGGAMHGIEVYPVVNECEGLAPGLYHYTPLAHALEPLSGQNELTEALLDSAAMASVLQYEPGVLFILTSRFQRTAWKYQSFAYALMLKDLGSLYQTFYLTATAMDLAPCAIGAGDSDLFARAAGLDYYEETSIGEFLLARPEPSNKQGEN